jgi:ADP-heptose:LPS heptosyltransferase
MSKEFGGTALTHWVAAVDDGLHQVDRALRLLDNLGVPTEGVPSTLHATVPEAAGERVAAVLAGEGLDPAEPYAVVLPGASCPSRRWPADRFRTAAALVAEQGLPVVVTGPGAEHDLVAAVAAHTPGVVPMAGAFDVPDLAALLAGAAVAMTNNSGGMHLADAVGTPVVALFAGTEDESQYRPRSVPSAVLRVPTTCSPCRQFRCPFDLECLDVAPSAAADAVLRLADHAE